MSATTPSQKRTLPTSLNELKKRRSPLRDYSKQVREELKPLDKLALWMTERVGTIGFFLVIFIWTVIWLGWNWLAPKAMQFDPPMAFVFWLFISNVIQILLMPLILVGKIFRAGTQNSARNMILRSICALKTISRSSFSTSNIKMGY
jgi:uncharacterized membrane protein